MAPNPPGESRSLRGRERMCDISPRKYSTPRTTVRLNYANSTCATACCTTSPGKVLLQGKDDRRQPRPGQTSSGRGRSAQALRVSGALRNADPRRSMSGPLKSWRLAISRREKSARGSHHPRSCWRGEKQEGMDHRHVAAVSFKKMFGLRWSDTRVDQLDGGRVVAIRAEPRQSHQVRGAAMADMSISQSSSSVSTT